MKQTGIKQLVFPLYWWILSWGSCPVFAQVINEVQSTQYKTLQSADRQYYDWIEIYNPTGRDIDLSGYGLSDSQKKPHKWTFPVETSIEAQGYLIVYASGLDTNINDEIHSNFKLASAGESLYLSNAKANLIDMVHIPALEAEISWQRSTDGATVWAMSHKATPGASNHPSYATTKAEAPTFSHKGGFYTSAEQLKLEITAENEVR
ncbi:MAG: lamin tail domain-containing protein, partial [Fibrobacter sp.]|nr:lamin tail domain-containing protein [Fibrobacter sp.]